MNYLLGFILSPFKIRETAQAWFEAMRDRPETLHLNPPWLIDEKGVQALWIDSKLGLQPGLSEYEFTAWEKRFLWKKVQEFLDWHHSQQLRHGPSPERLARRSGG